MSNTEGFFDEFSPFGKLMVIFIVCITVFGSIASISTMFDSKRDCICKEK